MNSQRVGVLVRNLVEEVAGRRIEVGYSAPGLQGDAGVAVLGEGLRDDMGRRRKGPSGRPTPPRPTTARCSGPHPHGGVVIAPRGGTGHRGQRIDVHHHRIGAVFSRGRLVAITIATGSPAKRTRRRPGGDERARSAGRLSPAPWGSSTGPDLRRSKPPQRPRQPEHRQCRPTTDAHEPTGCGRTWPPADWDERCRPRSDPRPPAVWDPPAGNTGAGKPHGG